MKAEKESVFAVLSAIDCSAHIEKKGNISYLSWAWAWQIVKKNYPTAFYTIYESNDGMFYHTDGRTCWVKTGVTIEGIEYIEYLPVMDYNNKSILKTNVTSFDVNKAVQRSLTKACARHGLGLYIYAGEDLPDTPKEQGAQYYNDVDDTEDELARALQEARGAKSLDTLQYDVWEKHPALKDNAVFRKVVNECKAKFEN